MAAKSSGSSEKTTRRTTTRRPRRTAAAETAVDAATPVESPVERAEEREFIPSEPARAPEPVSPPPAPPAATGDDSGFDASGIYDEPADNSGAPAFNRGDGGGYDSDGTGRRRRRRRRRRGGPDGPAGGVQQPPMHGGRHQRHQQRVGHHDQQRRQHPRHDRPRQQAADNGSAVTGTIEGVLELHPKGYGFIRDTKRNYVAQDSDPFVSSSLIEKYRLREGVLIRGDVGPGTKGQGPRLRGVETIDGRTPDEYLQIKNFDDLTAINPSEQIKLERGPRPITMRVMDLITPIGKGQRALLVAPPRSGKTMLLQDIADSVSENHPEIHLIVLLIDERPEEVTEMRRRVKGEVISSSMDREVESHVRISQLIIERAKRMAEAGRDVLVLLDSITRLGRAFNKYQGNSGRTGSGGLDVRALDIPRKLFGTARRFDEGGSLTVVGTALIDTGSRMDDVIFQEFKGTGNMELVLSRDLADRRIWPAIDITQSGTRREEKILSPEVLEGTTMLRRSLVSLNPIEAMEQLVKTLERFPSNAEFLARVRSIL